MILRRFALATVLAFLTTVGTGRTLEAQDWQVIGQSRQARGEESMRVLVRFASGHVSIKPAAPGILFQTEMKYDADHFNPTVRYNASSRRLRIYLSTDDAGADIDVDEDSPQRLDLSLAPDIPLNLTMELGATASDLELGGMALERAEIKTGASETTVRFSEVNPIACSRLEIAAGVARLEIEQLGNARCASMEVGGGLGDLTIDLTGSWFESNARLAVRVGLGHVTLRIPRSLGVRIDLNRLLASFNKAGFTKRGTYYISDGYDGARAKLDVAVHAVFGEVDIVWLDGRGR